MKRILALCFTIVAVIVGHVHKAMAINQPALPPCTEADWVIYQNPTVAIQGLLPSEPLTLGIQSKIAVGVPTTSGMLYRTACNYVGFEEYALWPITVQSVSWNGYFTTWTSPLNGNATLECTLNPFYTATFTPTSVGQHIITFSAHAINSNSSQKAWSSTPDPILDVYYVVLPQKRLAYLNFNGNWIGDGGQAPIEVNNLQNPPDWNRGALKVDYPSGTAKLLYNALEADGSPNLTRNVGTVRFWFKPNWGSTTASGSGPGAVAKLLEFHWGFNNSTWGLRVNNLGTSLDLISTRDICSTPTTHFSRTISWTLNRWHQIVVTYSPSATQLYVDGAPIGSSGSAMTFMARAVDGMNIGSGQDGLNQAKGYFDELETFNYPLGATQISQDYQTARNLDTDGDGLPNIDEILAGSDIDDPDTDGDGVVDGLDPYPLDPTRWSLPPTPNPSDTTPPTVLLIQPANTLLP